MNTHTQTDRFAELLERLRHFVSERDWEQYHSPKNLAMATDIQVARIHAGAFFRPAQHFWIDSDSDHGWRRMLAYPCPF